MAKKMRPCGRKSEHHWPLITGEHFPHKIPSPSPQELKQTAMPMTIVNSVIHMARLLFRQRECSRGEVRPWQRAKVVPVPGLFHSRAELE
jgi:hypothetical protein